MIDRARRRAFPPIGAVATAFGLLVTACIVGVARSRGIWLDELWSQRLGNPVLPLGASLEQNWLSDTHPPLANLLYRLVRATGATSIAMQRLLLNLSAGAFLLAGVIAFSRKGRWTFPLILAAIAVGLPGTIESFTDFRSYGWQIAAIVVVFQFCFHLLAADLPPSRSQVLLGTVALFLGLALHYVTGIIVSLFVAGMVVALWQTRQRRLAAWLLMVAGFAWVTLTVSGVILISRMRRDIDFGWITTTTGTGALLLLVIAILTMVSTPLVAIAAARNARGQSSGAGERRFAAVLIWTLVAGFVALLCINYITPIIVQRYLVGWQLALAALLVTLARPALDRSRGLVTAVMGVAAFMTIAGAVQAARNTGWSENRDRIAAAVQQCATTRVYAMSPWRLKTARTSNSARRESAVIMDGYRQLAGEAGFAITPLDLDTPARIDVGPACPTIIWIEHLDADYIPDSGYVLRVGQLRTFVAVNIAITRSQSGLMVVMRPGAGDQKRRAIPK